MNGNGWIKIHRKIRDHWLWKADKPFDKRSAWIDLLLEVNHEPGKVVQGNEILYVDRGETITSEVELAKRWGWSRTKVRNFLELLEKDGMILNKKEGKKRTRLKVLNYDIYQDSKNNKSTLEEQDEDKARTRQEQERDINKNNKNVKNEKKCISTISNEIVSFDNDTPPQEHHQQKENIPYQQIVEMYNSICLSLPKAEKITDKRRKHIRKAWNEFKGDISKFEEVFRLAEASDFLSGRSGRWTGCNFDWLVTYNNMVKVLEGTYDNKDDQGGYRNGKDTQYRRGHAGRYQRTGTYDKFYE